MKALKSGGESWGGFFAFTEKDKFSKTPLYAHLGVFAAGFANGALIGGFEKSKGEIFDQLLIRDNSFFQASTEFVTRGLGVTLEFGLTSFAKTKYKDLNFEGYGKKAGKSGPKVFGYLLTTYY